MYSPDKLYEYKYAPFGPGQTQMLEENSFFEGHIKSHTHTQAQRQRERKIGNSPLRIFEHSPVIKLSPYPRIAAAFRYMSQFRISPR